MDDLISLYCRDIKFANIKAIVFDKDGTLANSQQYLVQLAYKRLELIAAVFSDLIPVLLKSWGITDGALNPDGLMAIGTRLENEVVTAGYIAAKGYAWADALGRVHQIFAEADAQMPSKALHTPLFDGTIEMLSTLASTPLRLGILSADSQFHVDTFVDYYGLNQYFDIWLGTDSIELAKPKPEALNHICQKLGAEAGHTLVIGDSTIDLQLAHNGKAAGFFSVGSIGGGAPIEGADATLLHWSDLSLEIEAENINEYG